MTAKDHKPYSTLLAAVPRSCPRCKNLLEGLKDALTCSSCNASYPVINDIPRFVKNNAADNQQTQVQNVFGFKWTRDDWGFKAEHIELMGRFFRGRFGFASEEEVKRFFSGKLVLDAGIGNGQNENHFGRFAGGIVGVDISEAVDAAKRHWEGKLPIQLIQADICDMPFPDGVFDIALSDGVLHHTPDTKKALCSITSKTKAGGHVVFYVYKKKGPIREFVDDEIRMRIKDLSNEEAWKALEPLTALARELSKAGIKISIPEDIPLLDIHKGEYDLQRFLYWHVMKFYWNDALNFDENNHVNFDWYRPLYAHRHTPEEVKGWLTALGLSPLHFDVGDSGISVIAKKV